jgi:hypothetical protein
MSKQKPLLLAQFGALKIIKKEQNWKTYDSSKWRGSTTKKEKPNIIKADSSTPKIFIVCCSIVIRVQRWFVKL